MDDNLLRIAITGSSGFLGSASIEKLTYNKNVGLIVGIDQYPTNTPSSRTAPVISIVTDIRNPLGKLLEDYEINVVIHLAFFLRPPRNKKLAREVNVNATKSLLDACSQAGVDQFIYLSSTTVYGAHPSNEQHMVETSTPNPVSGFIYSEHKKEAEILIQKYQKQHPERATCILRSCVIMGHNSDNFISDSLQIRYLPTPIGFNPDMQFLHVEDYTSAIEKVLFRRARGIYNIAGAGTIQWRHMVKLVNNTVIPVPLGILKKIISLTWILRLQNRSPGPGLNFITYPWLASTEKIDTQLQWRPTYSSEDAVKSWIYSKLKKNSPRHE